MRDSTIWYLSLQAVQRLQSEGNVLTSAMLDPQISLYERSGIAAQMRENDELWTKRLREFQSEINRAAATITEAPLSGVGSDPKCEIVTSEAGGKKFDYCRTHKVESKDCPKPNKGWTFKTATEAPKKKLGVSFYGSTPKGGDVEGVWVAAPTGPNTTYHTRYHSYVWDDELEMWMDVSQPKGGPDDQLDLPF